MKLDSEGLLHVKEVEVAGGRVDERLKDIENYFSTEEDADSNLNKWHEIVNFLNGFEETDQVLENIINTKASKDEVSALSTKVDNNNTSVNIRIDGVETAYKDADSTIEIAYKAADAELQKDINTKATQDQVTQLNAELETVKRDYVSKQELESEVDTEHLVTDNITTSQSEFIFFADPYSNKIATIDVDGVSSIEFTAIQEDGTVHNLTNKANISELEVLENKIDSANSKITNLTTDSVKEGTTNKYFTNERAVSALSGTLNNYVPNTRKINNKVLSGDITLSVDDISGAVSTDTFNALDSSLATVAKSGSYNDLINKPPIPPEVTDSTVSGWGYMKKTTADSAYAAKSLENTVSLLQEQFDDLTATGGEPNVQSDWDVTNTNSDAFIKNKPDLSVYETKANAANTYAPKTLVDTVSQLSNTVSGKQNKIDDLNTIRSGASAGATALQPGALNGYLTESAADGKYATITTAQDLQNNIVVVDKKIPTKVSDLSDASLYATQTWVSEEITKVATGGEVSVPVEDVTVNGSSVVNNKVAQITVPTVNNGKITIKQNGSEVGSFTLNQSGNKTIELTNSTYSATDANPNLT
jgi:hypothetical protein